MTDRWIQILPLVAFISALLVADVIGQIALRAWNIWQRRKLPMPPGEARYLSHGEVIIRREDGRTFVATRQPRRR